MAIQAETQFEDHFPVTTMVSQHTGMEDVNRRIAQTIRELRDQYIADPKENEALSGTITTYGGYQTSKKMRFLDRPDPAIKTLRDEVVLPGAQRYMQRVFADQSLDMKHRTRMASWANI